MDPGAYFEMVIITALMALTFITLLLAFLYLIYGKEETAT
ncbi:MAG: hypothetical protein AOA65_2389 [Candidatus Bathyarchaeota archaeon BA1]|nr:MAG: hypothetical protein AOA65_2389 [Candidatus Bathyarchaeota archaeon BA1]